MPRLRHLTVSDENALQSWFMGATAPLSARVSNLETASTSLSNRVAAVETSNSNLSGRVSSLESGKMPSDLPSRVTAAETGITNLAQRLTTDEAAITSNTNRLTALESGGNSFVTWRNAKAAYMGRLPSGEPAGGLLGLGWAGAVNTAISEIRAYLNSKVAPALETRSITAAS